MKLQCGCVVTVLGIRYKVWCQIEILPDSCGGRVSAHSHPMFSLCDLLGPVWVQPCDTGHMTSIHHGHNPVFYTQLTGSKQRHHEDSGRGFSFFTSARSRGIPQRKTWHKVGFIFDFWSTPRQSFLWKQKKNIFKLLFRYFLYDI